MYVIANFKKYNSVYQKFEIRPFKLISKIDLHENKRYF